MYYKTANLLFLACFFYTTYSRQTKASQIAVLQKLKLDSQLWTNAFYDYYTSNLEDFTNMISNIVNSGQEQEFLKVHYLNVEKNHYTPSKSNSSINLNIPELRELQANITPNYTCGPGIKVNASKFYYYCNGTFVNASEYLS